MTDDVRVALVSGELDAARHAAEAIRDRFAELSGPLSRDSHHDALVILEALAKLRATATPVEEAGRRD